jgi:N-acetyl-anhydromuramyl-L-alanine amidase AmpD
MTKTFASIFLLVEDTERVQYFGISCTRGIRVLDDLSIGNLLQGFDWVQNRGYM